MSAAICSAPSPTAFPPPVAGGFNELPSLRLSGDSDVASAQHLNTKPQARRVQTIDRMHRRFEVLAPANDARLNESMRRPTATSPSGPPAKLARTTDAMPRQPGRCGDAQRMARLRMPGAPTRTSTSSATRVSRTQRPARHGKDRRLAGDRAHWLWCGPSMPLVRLSRNPTYHGETLRMRQLLRYILNGRQIAWTSDMYVLRQRKPSVGSFLFNN